MGFDEVDPEKRRPSKNFVIPVSDVQAYKQFGNSVVVPMMTAIAKQLRKDLVSGATTNSRIAS
jgi:DNA (cytosine-5)-methyltransferase 1